MLVKKKLKFWWKNNIVKGNFLVPCTYWVKDEVYYIDSNVQPVITEDSVYLVSIRQCIDINNGILKDTRLSRIFTTRSLKEIMNGFKVIRGKKEMLKFLEKTYKHPFKYVAETEKY